MRLNIIIIAVLAGFLCRPLSVTPQSLEMISCEIRDDFETGEKSAWETYPFFQDMGFNPTLSCTGEPARHGRFSLSQTFQPTDTDYPTDLNRVGVIKRICITTSDVTNIKFSFFVQSDRRPKCLDVILCSDEGDRFTKSIANPLVNEWIDIEIPLRNFLNGNIALGPNTGIEAIVIVAEFGVVSPDKSYSLNLDSISMIGKRQRRLIPVFPEGTWLEHFQRTVLHRHFHPREEISVSTRAEEMGNNNALKSVHCMVINPDGNIPAREIECFDNGTHGDQSGGDGIWSCHGIYRLGKTDPPGRWQIRLEGRTAEDLIIESTFDFLVPSCTFSPDLHPRLLFTNEDVKKRKDLQQNYQLLKQLYDEAVDKTKKELEGESISYHPEYSGVNSEYLGGGLFSPSWDQFERWINGLNASIPAMDCALLYSLTGDQAMGQRGKEFLLHVCGFRTWNHPWMKSRGIHMYYPVGYTAYRTAVAYDLLYPLMDNEERQLVREALLNKVIIPAYKGEVLDNHIPSNISNHLGVSCTGVLLALIALLGEDPENPYMEPYLSGILSKLEAHIDAAYLPDGSYAEPNSYFHMDAEMTVKAMACLLKNFCIDWTGKKGIGDAWQYSIYTSTPSGEECLDMGDGYDFLKDNGIKPLIWASCQMNNGIAWDRYLWTRGPDINKRLVADFFDYLWAPLDLEAVPVNHLPPSKWFWAKGFACFRGGWGSDDLLLLFKAGPHSNHHHLDQGNFLLRYGNENLLVEGGYADYYTNGYYHSFYEQAVAHNTVLVGNYPESQGVSDLRNQVKALDRYPQILDCFTGCIVDALESELSSVYKGRMNKFRRSIIFLKPDYLVLFDNITANQPESIQWLFHAANKDYIHAGSKTCLIRQPRASLRMEILEPVGCKASVKDHPDSEKGILWLSTTESVESTKFLSALIPSKEKNSKEHDKWVVSKVNCSGWSGIRVQRGDLLDEVYFREECNQGEMLPNYKTDSDRYVITVNPQGTMTRFWARNVTSFCKYQENGEIIFQVNSDKPASIALHWRSSVLEIESNLDDELNLVMKPVEKPLSVTLNGRDHSFYFNSELNSLSVYKAKKGNRND